MKLDFLNKRILLVVGFLLVLIPQSLMAQKNKPMNLKNYDNEPYHFGFILAVNQMSYVFNYIDNYPMLPHAPSEYPNTADVNYNTSATYYMRSIESSQQPGFTVGVVGNLRLGRYFDLRLIPSLSFGTRTIKYHIFKEMPSGSAVPSLDILQEKSILSTFVEFPLHVKYRAKRLNNVSAYLLAGGNFKIDLASQKKNQIDVTNAQGQQETVIDNIKVKKSDIALEIGTGFDFYNSYFKLGIEIKMSFGLLNILDSQNLIYDSSIETLHNRTLQLSLTFE